MQECGICYYDTSLDDLFPLSCCQHRNRMCLSCLHLLLTPVCPFCRKPLDNLPSSYMGREASFPPFRNAISYSDTSGSGGEPHASLLYLIDPSDDTILSSRSLRRRMKRMRKIQERERQAEYNRQLNLVLNESKRTATQQQRRRGIQSVIRQDHEIFQLEL